MKKVLEGGRYILGDQVARFESEFAEYLGAGDGVSVASGTDALVLALWACGVGPGDDVVTPSHTAVATVAAIRLRGATPVFIDIERETMVASADEVRRWSGARTKAIVVVHLYGHPVDLDAMRESADGLGVPLIEDCAQAHGATFRGLRVGSVGDFGCFSFYPTKNLGALGDGGFVATRRADLASTVRRLREYGWVSRYISQTEGMNSRLDELQAAVLRVKLRRLDEDNGRRREIAAIYSARLRGLPLELPVTRAWADHCFHQYVVRTPYRDDLGAFLKSRGIGTLVHYPYPVHKQPGYAAFAPPDRPLVETQRAADQVLSLPMFPELTDGQVQRVCTVVREYFETAGGLSSGDLGGTC
jgi:dTDP-4-amino-4,6-dideoxygalactose transaminase